MIRFERSTFPVHNDTRTVVLRFLKIITPVKCVIPSYDGHLCSPKEGELLRKGFKIIDDKLDQPVWSFNIDKKNGDLSRGLRLLWNT